MFSVKYKIKCSKCGRTSPSILDFRCSCGSPFETHLHFGFEKKKIRKRNHSLWRYVDCFPYVKEKEITSLGEGWTPLIEFSDGLYFKLDQLNPTGSFKDRGSAVLISALHKLVKKAGSYISEDSSGNAGASVAAYAARAGLKAKIYVPESVSGPKFNQIKFYARARPISSNMRSLFSEYAQTPECSLIRLHLVIMPS